MSATPSNGFWPFSVNAFGQPEIERICLALQDRHDIDVNLLLFCCWVGLQESALLSSAQIEALIKTTAEWQTHVVKPLRAVRRRLKLETGGISPQQSLALHRAVAGVELESEQLEQAAILQQAGSYETSAQPVHELAVANLHSYVTAANAPASDALSAELQQLVELLVTHARQRSRQV